MTPQLKRLSLWVAPLIGAAVTVLMLQAGWERQGALTVGLTVVCALWWVFEPIPIPATAMIPLGVFPLLGILDGKQVAQAYGDPLILLLMGGAMLSKAMEKSGAHRRLALSMVSLFGGDNQRRLVFGFMVASAVLSMWVSNTATTLMLLPVAYAVLDSASDEDSRKLAVPLFLGIAYAASIGGLGTPIGSPPNIVFLKIYAAAAASSRSMDYSSFGSDCAGKNSPGRSLAYRRGEGLSRLFANSAGLDYTKGAFWWLDGFVGRT